MEMASLRPACGSDFRHRTHPLADRRHVALRRPRRRRAVGLDRRRGQIHRPRAGELPARCLGPGPDRAGGQQEAAGGGDDRRQGSQGLARPCRSVARPHHHRCAPPAQASHHLARQWDGHRYAGGHDKALFTTLLGGAPVRVLHVRKGRIMLPGERGGIIKDIYAHLNAGKETGAVSGFGSFAYKDATVRYSLESGSVTTTGGAESFPLALTLTSKPFRARLSGTATNASEFKIDGDMLAEIDDGREILQMDRHSNSGRRQSEGLLGGGAASILPDRRSPSTTGLSRSTATRRSACLRSPRRSPGRAWKERSPSIAWCSIPISAAPSRARASSPRRIPPRPSPSTGRFWNSSTPICASRRRRSTPAR